MLLIKSQFNILISFYSVGFVRRLSPGSCHGRLLLRKQSRRVLVAELKDTQPHRHHHLQYLSLFTYSRESCLLSVRLWE